MGVARRLIAVGAIVGMAVVSAPAAASAQVGKPRIVVENGLTQPVFSYAEAIQEVVYVEAPMDSDGDGRRDLIEVDVVRPAETEAGLRVPTIMEASPYYGRETGDPLPDQTRGFPGWWDEYFVPRGYAVVQVEMQGTSRSFGCPTTGGPEDTISAKAVVDWLNGRAPGFHHDGSVAVADWSTGNVGMQGVSYVGTLPNAVATQGVRGLKTVVPIAAISSWYRYVNDQGVAWSTWSENVDFRYTEYLADYVSTGRTLPGSASAPACESVITGIGDAEEASASDFTEFWQERNYIPDAKNIKKAGTSVFMVHGLTDFNVKTMHTADLWREIEKRNMPRKIWLHRGAHVNPTSFRPAEWQAVMHRWMDYWLHDIENGIMDEPMADIQRPDGSWETHSSWPDAATKDVDLRFGPATADAAGTLSAHGPKGNPTQSYADQIESQAIKIGNAEQAAPGRLAYVTPPLAKEVRLSGTPELAVRMSTTAETALLSAMLVDYGPGPTVTVAGKDPLEVVQESCEPEDLASRTGCAEPMAASTEITPERVLSWGHIDVKNSPDLRRSRPLEPGKQYNVRWKTLPSEHVIPAGHRIGIVITGNYNANPTSNRPARDAAAVGSEVTVYLKGSSVTLPVVGGKAALGF
ncbi:CocE/NonD family hydrolase [Micromonospora musae]|uniref:Xaa-Pro dipeptidyl-peptidase n=1 Tax=Micromonospora musae TaxID=1894970 RepID=A0A3A9YFF4_9ACTN|nr:CocE/NonD family hydrolase [Micromonospora musae]